jgi:hypothetical protein
MNQNICIKRLSSNATKKQVVKSFIFFNLLDNGLFPLWQRGIQGELPLTAAGKSPLAPFFNVGYLPVEQR